MVLQTEWFVPLVPRLAYNGDVATGQLAVFQGGPSRTGGKAPISGFIRVKRATRKNSQLAAAGRVALKMGRRPRCSSVTSRTIFVPAGENQIGAENGAGGGLYRPAR